MVQRALYVPRLRPAGALKASAGRFYQKASSGRAGFLETRPIVYTTGRFSRNRPRPPDTFQEKASGGHFVSVLRTHWSSDDPEDALEASLGPLCPGDSPVSENQWRPQDTLAPMRRQDAFSQASPRRFCQKRGSPA
jgi:hypothetical protein